MILAGVRHTHGSEEAVMPVDSPRSLAQRAAHAFERRFGRPPKWIAAAPGRANLIGEHTDYNGGLVLPMAIERYTLIAADWAGDDSGSIYSQAVADTVPMAVGNNVPSDAPGWAKYVWGTQALHQKKGIIIDPIDVLIESNVPLGAGLSSSAALTVATATLIQAVADYRLDPLETALLCQQVEHRYAGVPCGLMDQATSVLARRGHLLLIDCQTSEFRPVALPQEAVTVVIADVKAPRALVDGEYAARRAQCEIAAKAMGVPSLRQLRVADLERAAGRLSSTVLRRAHHVVSEIERTLDAVTAIVRRDWRSLGELMYASHTSLRDDFEVSCHQLDQMVEIAQSIGTDGGVIGSRMTGAGFGGCTVSLVETSAAPQVARQMRAQYLARTGIEPYIFVSRPAPGAHVLLDPNIEAML